MRSSKSRSRNKPNRNNNNNRSVGNVINRVFDSSGPEGKVRGTPQQIIEKYNQLAQDAQLAGDRVATENFQQHAEHYLRILAVAQREQDTRREEQERQNRERQVERDRDRVKRQEREASADPSEISQPDMVEPAPQPHEQADSNLVETPESQPSQPPKRVHKPRSKKPVVRPDDEAPVAENGGSDAPEAAE